MKMGRQPKAGPPGSSGLGAFRQTCVLPIFGAGLKQPAAFRAGPSQRYRPAGSQPVCRLISTSHWTGLEFDEGHAITLPIQPSLVEFERDIDPSRPDGK